ncbi:LysE family translocator [Cupriavidus gilardii]|jgi:threonine/homoserine/homoserine lactone efflux protein|uniref:LysE family translocator n=1 Tax=Cupriavidus gilardii TaxID=82541 RepID=UPI0015802C50|nr:LysE family translocator [Cupriavidus gilardii]MCT9074598.1 LysE family translocator [Cupriavidus gilardii]QKS61752.1 LysE family translocator [Cupriavidus gilardii]
MNIWLFLIPFAIAAALPGPAQGALFARVISRGAASASTFIVGMVAGNAVWLLAAIFGLSALAVRFATVFVAIKWLGVMFLLYMAWRLWRSDGNRMAQQPERSGSGFIAGAFLTLGNPKAMVFFGAVLPQAFDMTALSAGQIALILALGVAVDFSVQLFYLMLARQARSFISSPKRVRIADRTAAAMMAGCAGAIAVKS